MYLDKVLLCKISSSENIQLNSAAKQIAKYLKLTTSWNLYILLYDEFTGNPTKPAEHILISSVPAPPAPPPPRHAARQL